MRKERFKIVYRENDKFNKLTKISVIPKVSFQRRKQKNKLSKKKSEDRIKEKNIRLALNLPM